LPLWNGVAVTNPSPASGGTEAETIEEAKLRVQRELELPTRAVTADDYEAIAKTTPGLRVARAKAIPLYKPGLRDYPRVKAQGQMTVVVVPYAETEQPTAGPGFLDTVRRHLDRYRLLTTELHVMPAAYIRITVHAVVVVEPKHKNESGRIHDALRHTLSPVIRHSGAAADEGWAFGRSVYRGDLYGVISRLKGVAYVQDLWVDAEGAGAMKDGAGDVHLPPYGLVYSGDHEIEIVSLTDIQP
jgi:predicted phage baseplate assembly protein